jgi:hypothetical protein
MSQGALLVGQELIDVHDAEVENQGQPLTMHTGRARWHAIRGQDMTALCGTAERRLLPVGQPWSSAFPERVERWAACGAARTGGAGSAGGGRPGAAGLAGCCDSN